MRILNGFLKLFFISLLGSIPFGDSLLAEDHKKEEKKEEKKKKLSPAEELAKNGGVVEVKDPDPKSKFIVLDPLIIPIVQKRELKANISFSITIEVTDPSFRKDFYNNIYPIRNKIFTDFYGILSVFWTPSININQSFFKKRIEKIIVSYLPPKEISNILFQKISIIYPNNSPATYYISPSPPEKGKKAKE